MSQKCRQDRFFTIIFPLHRVYVYTSECICLRIQGMIHTDDECTLKRAVVLSNPPTVRVQFGECCNYIQQIYQFILFSLYQNWVIFASQVFDSFFFYLGYERYNLGSALRPQNMEMYSLRQFHLLRYVCTVKTYEMGGDNWPGRSRKQWIEPLAIGSVFSIHLSVSNCMYWKVFYSNISHGVNLSETNLSFWH